MRLRYFSDISEQKIQQLPWEILLEKMHFPIVTESVSDPVQETSSTNPFPLIEEVQPEPVSVSAEPFGSSVRRSMRESRIPTWLNSKYRGKNANSFPGHRNVAQSYGGTEKVSL